MINNDFNKELITKEKARFEIQYYGMSFEDFVNEYGAQDNYRSSKVIEYITKF